MFVLCKMVENDSGGLFSLFDLSLDMSSHTSMHNIQYAHWQQAVNAVLCVKVTLYKI